MATAAEGSGHGELAGEAALTGHAWLAALPDDLAAQRRLMAGLAERCAAWPLAASLLVGCSLGRGAADALSDIDAALGVDAPRGEAGAARVETAEAMVAAALPELGPLVDVLRHRTGPAGQHARRIFAQFADGTRLDLALVAEAEIDDRRRHGGAPDFVPLYQAPAAWNSSAPDAGGPAGVGGARLIEQDFVFCGILTAKLLSKFRDLGPGRGAAGTIRTERARPGHGRRPQNITGDSPAQSARVPR
jgi:hypothetical protein